MKCPRCGALGALVGIARVDCCSRACVAFHAPLRQQLDQAPPRGEFSGDDIWLTRTVVYKLERLAREAGKLAP